MSKKLIILVICFLLSFSVSTTIADAQMFRDTISLRLLKTDIDCIYNMQFKEAGEICNKLKQSYPGHPIILLLQSMIIYWENYPLSPSSNECQLYENDLHTCIKKCEKSDSSDEPEYLLSNLCARGMLLLYYADNDLSSKSISLVTSTYGYIRRSFSLTHTYSDFYFFTGLYNYYREAYPAAYPIYRSLAFLFPSGDREKGLNELRTASVSSIFLKAESSYYLSSIYQSFENNFMKAFYFSRSLHELYPSNTEYWAYYIKNLLLIKNYDEAENLIVTSSSKIKNPFYQAQLMIFEGIVQEKKYHDNKTAEQDYTKGVSDIASFGVYGNEYAAYAYFGLSRISKVNNDRHDQKLFRKKAMDMSVFKSINFDE
jgi:hypothetical protein